MSASPVFAGFSESIINEEQLNVELPWPGYATGEGLHDWLCPILDFMNLRDLMRTVSSANTRNTGLWWIFSCDDTATLIRWQKCWLISTRWRKKWGTHCHHHQGAMRNAPPPPPSEGDTITAEMLADFDKMEEEMGTAPPPPPSEGDTITAEMLADFDKMEEEMGNAPPPPPPSEGDTIIAEMLANLDKMEEEMRNAPPPPPPEGDAITADLTSSRFELMLKRNESRDAKCCAGKCLVYRYNGNYHERIEGPYRVNLKWIQLR